MIKDIWEICQKGKYFPHKKKARFWLRSNLLQDISVRKFYNRMKGLYSCRMKASSSGYILVLMTIVIPILLLGVKLGMDKITQEEVEIERSEPDGYYKRCAREAALAVAENWNPGLTLGQQKEGIYKVADAVYNAHPVFHKSAVGEAIPGLDIKRNYKIENNPELMQMEVSNESETITKTVGYTTSTKYISKYYTGNLSGGALWNYHYVAWLAADKASDPLNRLSQFDEVDQTQLANARYILKQHEIYQSIWPLSNQYSATTNKYYNGSSSGKSEVHYISPNTSTGTSGNYNVPKNISSYFSYKTNSRSSGIETSTYTKRSTGEDSKYVMIAVENDKLKIATDNDIAYAQPAQCNVDIILAIPTNGAACNANNSDTASDTVGNPYTQEYSGTSLSSTGVKNVPIYQMGQACKNFVKDNFYHVRGVNMGLIPYSGKVSLSPDRTSWTVAVPKFDDTAFHTQVMMTSCLYGTSGEKDAKLRQDFKTKALDSNDDLPTTDTAYYWGGGLTGCPIMCRRGELSGPQTRYGGNQCFYGNLTSDANPATDALKYVRINLNPCYGGYANQLSMKCERACTHYQSNPYYIIEPTSDLVKIYEMCNALYPINDPYNVSNFVFIPIEWARNLFQSWTRDVTCESNDDQLSRTSKMASGRKKVLILLVNKPDWFEPGELTYLGFDNDASEFPVAESDKIDFSINYSDTSKKFLDGTSYNGTIQGPKKILKFTTENGKIERKNGYYECTESGTFRLVYPHKGQIKLKITKGFGTAVNNGSVENMTWTDVSNYRLPDGTSTTISGDWKSITTLNDDKIWAGSENGYIAYSADGVTWTVLTPSTRGDNYTSNIYNPVYVSGNGYVFGAWTSGALYSSNGNLNNWTLIAVPDCSSYQLWNIVYGNGKFVAAREGSYVAYSYDGQAWYSVGNVVPSSGLYCIFANGQFVLGAQEGYLAYSTDGQNWSLGTYTNTREGAFMFVIAYGNGKYVAAGDYGYVSVSNDGKTWTSYRPAATTKSTSNHINGLAYGGGIFLAAQSNTGYVFSSTDGINWNNLSNYPAYAVQHNTRGNRVAYSDKLKKFFIACVSGKIYSSSFGASTFQFKNLSSESSVHTITRESEFVINTVNLPNIKDSGGNYYIEFEMNNIRLISAEIDNLQMDSLNSRTVSYTEGDITNYDKSGAVLSWGTRTTTETVTDTINLLNGETYKGNIAYIPTYSEEDYTETLDLASGNTNGEFINYSPVMGMRTCTDTIDLSTGEAFGDNLSYKPITGLRSVTDTIDFTKGSTASGKLSYSIVKGPRPRIDTINFSSGGKSGLWMEYSTTSGVTSYVSGYGQCTSTGNTANGRITTTAKPIENMKLIVKYAPTSLFEDWQNQGGDWQNQGSVIPSHSSAWADGSGGSAYGNGYFLRMTQKGTTYRSSDNGASWSSVGTLPSASSWDGLAFGNGRFIAVSRYGNVAYSDNNGSSWISVSGTPLSGFTDEWFGNVAYKDGDTFLAMDQDGNVATTTNKGATWSINTTKSVTSISSNYWYGAVCYGAGKFVTINRNGKVAYSTDGVIWNSGGSLSGGERWYGLAYGEGKFIALSYNGYTSSSSNGTSWSTPINSLGSIYSSYWFNISYGNGAFVAMTQAGYVATYSPNATSSGPTTGTIAINSGSSRTIGSTETAITITPSQWTSNGSEYYVNFSMQRIALVSASGTFEANVEVGGRLTFPIKNTVKLQVNKGDEAATLKFTNVGDSSTYTITSSKTFNINPSQISSTDDKGNYYIEFEKENIVLELAWITYDVYDEGGGRLTFPNKGTVTIFVSKPNWQYYPQALNPSGETSSSSWCNGYRPNISYGNGVFVATSTNGYTAYSLDGVFWSRGTYIGDASRLGCVRTGTHFIALGNSGGGVAYSTDGKSWTRGTPSANYSGTMDDGFCYDANLGRLYITSDSAYWVTTAQDGMSGWNTIGSSKSTGSPLCDYQQWEYGGGYYIAYRSGTSNYMYSSDGLNNFSAIFSFPLSIRTLTYANGLFMIMDSYGRIGYTTDITSNTNWKFLDGAASATSSLYTLCGKNNWCGLGYGDGKLVICTNAGDVAVWNGFLSLGDSYITFKNAGSSSKNVISDDQTFTFTADQISNIKDDAGNYYIEFEKNNINLISASIQYEKEVEVGGRLSLAKKGNVTLKVRSLPIATPELNWVERSSGTTNTLVTVNFLNGIFLAGGVSGTLLTSPNGINWTSRTTNYSSDVRNSSYGNGQYIVAGHTAAILRSTDGINWQQITQPDGTSCACFGNNMFVVGGYNGLINTSTDGVNWTEQTRFTSNNESFAIYANNKFVMCGGDGALGVSSDGITWRSVTSGISQNCRGIAYGAGMFAIACNSGIIITSSDGETWTSRTGASGDLYGGMAYGNGLFLTVNSSGQVYGSTDGITWSAQNSPSSFTTTFSDYGNRICYSNTLKRFCVVGNSGKIYTADWNPYGSTVTPYLKFTNVSGNTSHHTISGEQTFTISSGNYSSTYGDETTYYIEFSKENIDLVSATLTCKVNRETGGRIFVPKQGKVTLKVAPDSTLGWIKRDSGVSHDLLGVKRVNGKFFIGGDSGTLLCSNDGITWSKLMTTVGASRIYSTSYGNGVYVTGYDGGVLRSANGMGWSINTSTEVANVEAVAYGAGKFVIGDYYGNVGYSEDNGSTWKSLERPFSSYLIDAIHVNGKFIMSGDADALAISEDGITWTKKITSIQDKLTGLCYGSGRYLVVGRSMYPYYSTDALSWTAGSSGLSSGNYYGATYARDAFFVSSSGGTIYKSSDGSSWSSCPSPSINLGSSTHPNRLCYSNALRRFVISGKSGAIYTADYNEGASTFQLTVPSQSQEIITAEKTITIPESSITSKDTAGIYYVDFKKRNAHLVSASIEYEKTNTIQTLKTTKNEDIALIVDKDSSGLRLISANISGHNWGGLSYGNGRYVAVCASCTSRIASSFDGESWSNGNSSGQNAIATCIDYNSSDQNFYSSTSEGTIYSSPDGVKWASYATAPISSITRIACGNSCIVVQNRGKQTASYNQLTKTWTTSSLSTDNCALCYGGGKFLSIQCTSGTGTGTVYSSTDGVTWESIGSGQFGNSGFAGNVCYGNGKFVTLAANGYIRYSTDGGVTWNLSQSAASESSFVDISYGSGGFIGIKSGYVGRIPDEYLSTNTINSYITLGSGSRQQVTGRTTLSISASSLTTVSSSSYYIDLKLEFAKRIRAATYYSASGIFYDLIDFNNGNLTSQNGVMSATFNGSSVNGFYTLGSSGTGSITLPHRGSIELTVAPAFGVSSGTIKTVYGSNTSNRTISSKTTITISKSDMKNANGLWYMDFTGSNVILLKATYNFESTLNYPLDLTNGKRIDWRETSISIPSGVTLSGEYSNMNEAEGYHQLNSSNCYPTMSLSDYPSDITGVFGALSLMRVSISMPDYAYTSGDLYLVGYPRIFSPMRRDSARQTASFAPYSSTYNNITNLIETSFSMPYNMVLRQNGYQGSSNLPTAAAAKVTADVCGKLKTDHGSNLRIYVIKYKAQSRYKLFPDGTMKDHIYTEIDDCATSGHLYSINSESELKTQLSAIASDIKFWAGYEAAKLVE